MIAKTCLLSNQKTAGVFSHSLFGSTQSGGILAFAIERE